MSKINNYRSGIERFMSGDNGQRFFNIAYSIGAAIVILGALFKILHITGGDTLLAIGMGTEVLMFILTAFERPYMESSHNSMNSHGANVNSDTILPEYNEEKVLYSGKKDREGHTSDLSNGGIIIEEAVPSGSSPSLSGQQKEILDKNLKTMNESMQTYIEQMSNLNRNISGLNTLYEIQLKNVSSQLNSLEYTGKSMLEMQKLFEGTAQRSEIFQEESEKLVDNMKKLNEVYENMLRAMNVQK